MYKMPRRVRSFSTRLKKFHLLHHSRDVFFTEVRKKSVSRQIPKKSVYRKGARDLFWDRGTVWFRCCSTVTSVSRSSSALQRLAPSCVLTGQVHSQIAQRCFPSRCAVRGGAEESRKLHSFILCLRLYSVAQVENGSHPSEIFIYCTQGWTGAIIQDENLTPAPGPASRKQ